LACFWEKRLKTKNSFFFRCFCIQDIIFCYGAAEGAAYQNSYSYFIIF